MWLHSTIRYVETISASRPFTYSSFRSQVARQSVAPGSFVGRHRVLNCGSCRVPWFETLQLLSHIIALIDWRHEGSASEGHLSAARARIKRNKIKIESCWSTKSGDDFFLRGPPNGAEMYFGWGLFWWAFVGARQGHRAVLISWKPEFQNFI